MSAPDVSKRPRTSVASFFLRGIATLLPVALTAFVFITIFQFANNYVTRPINRTIYWSLENNGAGWQLLGLLGVHPYEAEYVAQQSLPLKLRDLGERSGYASPEFREALETQRQKLQGFWRDLDELWIDRVRLRTRVEACVHPLIGVLLSLTLILWMGWLVTSFVGRYALARIEQALLSLPGVRSVYPYAKQLVDFFFKEGGRKGLEFQSVVAVRYPSSHLWSYGFLTNRASRSLSQATGEELVAVFIPSTPLPMSGFTIHVAQRDLHVLPISVDDALKMIVSGGVILPPSEVSSSPLERTPASAFATPTAPRAAPSPSVRTAPPTA
jgi:uncharacterized membrane protein